MLDALVVGEPLEHLRGVVGEHGDEAIHVGGDFDDEIGLHGAGFCEEVDHVGNDRVDAQRGHIVAHGGNGDEVGGVLHGLADGAVVGVVVVESVREDEVGLEGADLADDSEA